MESQYIKDAEKTLLGIFSWMVWTIPTLGNDDAWLSERISANCRWQSNSLPCQDWLVTFRRGGIHNHHRFYCVMIIWCLVKIVAMTITLGNSRRSSNNIWPLFQPRDARSSIKIPSFSLDAQSTMMPTTLPRSSKPHAINTTRAEGPSIWGW